jgi:hypothetical protein
LANAALNFASAFVRQSELTGTSLANAFDQHFALLDAFFPAAFIFAAEHLLGVAAAGVASAASSAETIIQVAFDVRMRAVIWDFACRRQGKWTRRAACATAGIRT